MKVVFLAAMVLLAGVASAGTTKVDPDDFKCTMCEKVIKYIDDWLDSGAGHQEIEVLIKQFCHTFPQYELVCDAILEVEVKQLIQWIESFPPKQVCHLIKLCPASEPEPVNNACTMCTTVIKYIDDWLASGAGKQELVILIEQMCKMFPQYELVCDKIVEMEIDELIQWIESFEPAKVCAMLGLCPKDEDMPAPVNDNCAICKRVIGFIEDWIESGAGHTEIVKLIEALCAYMGPEYKDICDAVLEMELEQLIQWIKQAESPEVVCKQLKLCQADAEPVNDKCSICKRVIGFIEDWIESGAGHKEIVKLIEALCAYMGPEYKDICDAVLEMELEQLIQWIKQAESPEVVCKQLKQCAADVVPVEKKDKCEICKLVIGLLEHWLEDQKTIKEIEVLISDLCAVMGPSYADICTAILDMELEELIHWIETSEQPEVVCRQLKQCKVKVAPESFGKCEACKVVYDILKEFLTNPRSEQEIIAFLDKACAFFPKYQSVCDELVAFGVMELAELVQKYDDLSVCTMIGLCP